MNKKSIAKAEVLKQLSKIMSDDMYEGVGEGLKGKKLQKVTVAAPDKKGLQEGLSKAQQILAAKFGDVGEESDEPSEDEEGCGECGEPDCPYCSEL